MQSRAIARPVLQSVLGLCLFSGAAAANAADEPAALWLLVTPPEFRSALQPLVQHRQAQGVKVVVLQTTDALSEEQLRQGDGMPLGGCRS
jgi:hypothetical protein